MGSSASRPSGQTPKGLHSSKTHDPRRAGSEGPRNVLQGVSDPRSGPVVTVMLRVVEELDSGGTHFVVVEAPASWAKAPNGASSTPLTASSRSLPRSAHIDGDPRQHAIAVETRRRELVFDVLTRGNAGIAEMLTERELQIAALVAGGELNKRIAARLRISEYTVSTHIRRMFSKLGIKSRSSLAAMYAVALAANSDVPRDR